VSALELEFARGKLGPTSDVQIFGITTQNVTSFTDTLSDCKEK